MGPEATGLCGDKILDIGIIWTRLASQILGKDGQKSKSLSHKMEQKL